MLARMWRPSVLDGDLQKNFIVYHTVVKKNEINLYAVIQNNVLDMFGRTKYTTVNIVCSLW